MSGVLKNPDIYDFILISREPKFNLDSLIYN